MGENNALITDLCKEIGFNDIQIEELKKYNNDLGKEIFNLNNIYVTRDYNEEKWKDLYDKSKDNIALKIALLKANGLPYKYEEKLVKEIPKEAICCVWESCHTRYDSIIKALELMLEAGYDIENISLYIKTSCTIIPLSR